MVHSRFEEGYLKLQCANLLKQSMEVLIVPYQNASESFETQVACLNNVLIQHQAHPAQIKLMIVESNYGLKVKEDFHQKLFSFLSDTFKESDIIAYSGTGHSLQKAQENKRISIMYKGNTLPLGLCPETVSELDAQKRYYTLEKLRSRLKSFCVRNFAVERIAANEDLMALTPLVTHQYDLEQEIQKFHLIEISEPPELPVSKIRAAQ